MPDRGIDVVVNKDFSSILYIHSIMYEESDYIEQPMLHNRRLYICNDTAFIPNSAIIFGDRRLYVCKGTALIASSSNLFECSGLSRYK